MALKNWSTTPASNNATPPNGWPESTMLVNQINDTGRQMMADVRAWYEDAQWIDYGHTPTRVSATVFSVPGTHSGTYSVNRRIRVADAATYLGSISDVTAAGGITSVTLALDSGSLTGSLSAVSVAAITGDSLPAALLDTTDIGVTVQGYDADTMKSDTAARLAANMGFTPVTDTSSSGAVTFDFATGNIAKITLSENITSITLSNAAAGDVLEIWVTQAAGGYTVTGWPAAVKWSGGGTAYTASTTNGAVDIIMLRYDGTNYYGSYQTDHQ